MNRIWQGALLLTLAPWGLTACDSGEASAPDATEAATEVGADAPAADGPLSILTGSKEGNYFKAATELRDIFAASGVDLEIRESPGSFHNIEQLGTGKTDLAIAQFDTLMLYMGMDKDRRDMANNAVVLAPLRLEYVHIISNKQAKIKKLQQLAGKKINVGPEHSGSWISAKALMAKLTSTNVDTAADVHKLAYKEALAKVAAGELDAMFVTTTPGMPLLAGVAKKTAKKLALLSLGDKFTLPKSLEGAYSVQEIPAKTYPFQKKKVTTLATPSYLLTSRSQGAQRIAQVAALVYGKSAQLKQKSSLWQNVSTEAAKREIANDIPYHDGVKKHLGL